MLYPNKFTKAKEILAKHNQVKVIKLILDNNKAWEDLEHYNNSIRNQLYAIAANEDNAVRIYPISLYQDVYAVLLMFAQSWPLNLIEEEAYMSPVSLEKMNKPIYLAKGYHYNIDEIDEGLLQNGRNAVCNSPLLSREVKYMRAKLRLLLGLRQTEAEILLQQQQQQEESRQRYFDVMEEMENACIISSMVISIPLLAISLPAAMFLNILFLIPAFCVPFLAGIGSFLLYREKLIFSQLDEALVDDDQFVADAESLMDKVEKNNDIELLPLSSTAAIASSLQNDQQLPVEASAEVALDVEERYCFERVSYVHEEIFHHVQARSFR
jgi:hypothetical protein